MCYFHVATSSKHFAEIARVAVDGMCRAFDEALRLTLLARHRNIYLRDFVRTVLYT